jgi:hypothetical protein
MTFVRAGRAKSHGVSTTDATFVIAVFDARRGKKNVFRPVAFYILPDIQSLCMKSSWR